MKVQMRVSTSQGVKPGEVAEVSEAEGRSLIAQGFATEAPAKKAPAKKKGTDPEATATGDDEKKEG